MFSLFSDWNRFQPAPQLFAVKVEKLVQAPAAEMRQG